MPTPATWTVPCINPINIMLSGDGRTLDIIVRVVEIRDYTTLAGVVESAADYGGL